MAFLGQSRQKSTRLTLFAPLKALVLWVAMVLCCGSKPPKEPEVDVEAGRKPGVNVGRNPIRLVMNGEYDEVDESQRGRETLCQTLRC